jgi:hypothetical protein
LPVILSVHLQVEVCVDKPCLYGFLRHYETDAGNRHKLFVIEFSKEVTSGVFISTSQPTMNKAFFSDYGELPNYASGKLEWGKPSFGKSEWVKPSSGPLQDVMFTLTAEHVYRFNRLPEVVR